MKNAIAVLLAAAPLRLPIMRLIQKTLLPASEQVHLAEVFTSGLLQRDWNVEATANPDSIHYDFLPDVREVLLSLGLLPNAVQVQRIVSEYIAERFGQVLDFQAFLLDPAAFAAIPFEPQLQPFAMVTATVLRRLGGLYAAAAERWLTRVEWQQRFRTGQAATRSAEPQLSPNVVFPGLDLKEPKGRIQVRTQGIPAEQFQSLAEELGVTKMALTSFFKIMEQQHVPSEDLDAKLREIATRYKTLLERVRVLSADDPHIAQLRGAAETAIREGDFELAGELLNEASERDVAAVRELQNLMSKRLLSAAEAKAVNGDWKMTQLAYAAAADYYRQAAEFIEHMPVGGEQPLALYLNEWGSATYLAGDYKGAEPPLQQALALREKALGPDHPDVATSLNNLAELYRAQGRYSEAEPLYQRALAIYEAVLGAEHPNVAASFNNLAELYRAQGRYSEAEPLYQRALALWERVLGAEHPDVATSLNNLAELYRAQGRYSEAEPLYQRALAIYEAVLGTEHPNVAQSLNNLALLYHEQGRYSEAEPLYQRALALGEGVLGAEHPDVATSLNNLAELYRAQGRYSEAEPLYQRALTLWERVLGAEHPDVATLLRNYAALLRDTDRSEEAEKLEIRSKTRPSTIPQQDLGDA
jgi:tetratricopeptide (TPR) repeat protein